MRLIKTLIKLAILFAIGHAAYKVGPAYWHYIQFRDEVTEVARFSSGKTENDIRDRIAKLIDRHELPLDASEVAIEPGRASTAIDASYEQQIEVLPKYFYPWKFDVKVDVMHVRPTSVEQIPR
jgi:hypothetical protein